MPKVNCWEFHECCQPGQECPARKQSRYDGVNNGTASGRFCWAVAGTLCEGEIVCTKAKELKSCIDCLFYGLVEAEESENHINTREVADMWKKHPN